MLLRSRLAVVLAIASVARGQSAFVALSPRLAEWKAEIESAGAVKVVLARVHTDASRNELILPADTEARPILRRFFLEETFREQFVRTHAMTVSYSGAEGRYSFIVLNMALEEQWAGAEESVIAHELGHAWLAALGFPAPAYEPGERSCLAVHAGDIVQHVLIRKEMDRRHIAWRDYWTRNLRAALERLQSQVSAGPLGLCQLASIVALWADTRLAFSEADWDDLPRFFRALEQNFPAAKAPTEALVGRLKDLNLWDRQVYAAALLEVSGILGQQAGPTRPWSQPAPQ